jgi:hypothetical protein
VTEGALRDPSATAPDPEIPNETRSSGLLLRALRPLWPWLVLAILTWLGWREVSQIDLERVRNLLRDTPDDVMLALFGATALNLAVAGLYDVVALGPRLRAPGSAARWSTGVVSFSWSNFLTIGPLAGPAPAHSIGISASSERARADRDPRRLRSACSAGAAPFCSASRPRLAPLRSS